MQTVTIKELTNHTNIRQKKHKKITRNKEGQLMMKKQYQENITIINIYAQLSAKKCLPSPLPIPKDNKS